MTPEQVQSELDYYDDSQLIPEAAPLPDDMRVLAASGSAGDEDNIPW